MKKNSSVMTGLITIPSIYSVKETMNNMAAIVESNGLTVFARIDHAANAEQVSLELRPTELIIFGNPKAGTILMQDKQTAGLELPMRALAWEDEQGNVWLTYNEASWIATRHELTEKSDMVVKAIDNGMAMIGSKATGKN